jgi:hypothetical protein
MKRIGLLVICLTVGALQGALADPQTTSPARPRVISKTHQPAGTPHKASSFAPRTSSRSHVYGAPIQPPILTHVRQKKPEQPK